LTFWGRGRGRGGRKTSPPTHPIPHNMDQWKLDHLQPHKGHQAHTTSSIESCSQHTTSILHKALGEHFLVYLESTLSSRISLKEERYYTYYSLRGRDLIPTLYSRLSLVKKKTQGRILHLLLKIGRDVTSTIL